MSFPHRKISQLLLLAIALGSSRHGYSVSAFSPPLPTAISSRSATPLTSSSDSSHVLASTTTSSTSSSSSSTTSNNLQDNNNEDDNELDIPCNVYQRVFEIDQRPIILFDGVCNMCNSAVNLALDWDPKGKLRFAALQSNVGRSLLQYNGREANDISSIVLVTPTGAYIKSDAILKITEALTAGSIIPLKPTAILGQYLIPKFIRDIIYDGVANNRYSIMGKRNECRLDHDGEFANRFINDELAMKQ